MSHQVVDFSQTDESRIKINFSVEKYYRSTFEEIIVKLLCVIDYCFTFVFFNSPTFHINNLPLLLA